MYNAKRTHTHNAEAASFASVENYLKLNQKV